MIDPLGITVRDQQASPRFHGAALAAGARDNGAPGMRAHDHPDCHGAFVIDPDGVKLEAVCHAPS